MTEPKDKGIISLRNFMNSARNGRRNTSMFRQDLVAQPDTVNETMRVSGMGPERKA